MSRGEDVSVGSRQNASRYFQITESIRGNKSGKKKNSFNERKTQSQKIHGNNNRNGPGVPKQFSLQDMIKVSPGYASNIEHLAFQDRQPAESAKSDILSNFTPKISRGRFAEVIALSRTMTAGNEKKGWAETGGGGGGAGHQHRSVPESTSREPACTKEVYRLGASANVDLVHAAVLNFKSLRKSDRRSLDRLDDEMASSRGQNVSILHVRGPPDPWDPPITSFADAGGSLRTAPKINSFRTGCSTLGYQNDLPGGQHTVDVKFTGTLSGGARKRDPGPNSVSLFIASGVNSTGNLNSANRELSPVRWCDREVDGVYLGRSGWVQVQQRSLDESRRNAHGSKTVTVTSTLPNRIKLSHYHCNSEPGERLDARKPRPDYLPLPVELGRNRENHKTPSPLLQEYDSLSPPSITPIISPPPAFQDPGAEPGFQSHMSRSLSGKPPFLPRSKAVIDSESPPGSPTRNVRGTSSLQRFKRTTPSPVSASSVLLDNQTKSFEDHGSGSRRNQFQRYNESSTSSSSSSFGFRSLDGSIARSSAMPRLNETDSSVEGYEDDDLEEEHRRGRSRLKSPPNGDRASPNALRHRNSQRTGRRTPSSDANGKKFGNRSSSSSESCSSCERKSPNSGFRRFNQRQSREQQNDPWDVRNSRVRRSRSLQLPEKRSPNVGGGATPSSSGGSREQLSPDYPVFYPNTKNGSGNGLAGTHRVVVKVNGEAVNTERSRRFAPKKAQSEDAKYEELRREAEEETRIITEYLNSTRSRAAARDLLMHRFLNRPEEGSQTRVSPVDREVAADPLYNVYFVGNSRRSSQKKLPPQRSPGNPNPCNPSSCDFWPHCAHRDVITYPKQPNVTSPPNMKSSQSYPAAANRKPEKSRKDDKSQKENRASSTRSSPASLESVTDRKPPADQKRQSSHRQNGEKTRSKFENVDIDGYVSVARREDRKGKYTRDGSSSSSSSSSDAYLTTSGKSSKTQKSSGASTPMEEYVSANSKSPSRDHDPRKGDGVYSPRPGSAPNETEDDLIALDAQRRSLSLPKSFLSNGYKNSKQSGLFPWRRQFSGMTAPNPGHRPLTPEISKTAPATPVREANIACRDKERVKQPQYIRSSSTPLLDEPPNPDWDLRRDLSQGTEEPTKESKTKEIVGQRSNLANQSSESVLQKFKKSFSLRFHKAQKGSSREEIDDGDELVEEAQEEEEEPRVNQPSPPEPAKIAKEDGPDQKFRFGPLVWRSSKERKKGKKAVRSAKCNSGDSGIQIENALNLPEDSSESHDTDHQDDLDSPPVIRRRTASVEKSSRPQSEVINQILIDKFKADLQWRAQSKCYPNRRVRRTNSDLGGQRLFNWELRNNYRRMLSTPSPVKGKAGGRKPSPEGAAIYRGKRLPGRAQLRRSMSQPLGLNELSPLMRRKASVARNQVLSEDEHDGRAATSDDEALSDSESSVTSLTDRKKSFEQAMDEEVVILAEAVWDHVAMEPEELAFRAGDVIEVLDTLDRDWWWGATGDNYGWFPSAFVRLRVSQEDTVEDCLEAMASGGKGTKQLRRRTSISLLSNDQVRSSVVRELLNTERDFVKVLRDVTEGYISECRRRTDMFTESQIQTIFSNLEDLLSFQSQFLEDLEVRVDRETPHRSCVGEIFLKHRSGFRMYSEYCNSHPMAIATLQELYQRNNYSKFFEACRLMRGLIEIPLDGYLLTPIQRICKYPLQLAELLKYTKPDHADHHKVKEALETMRGVAVLINERKRRMESLEKLAAWQQRVEAWEGEDLIETSTQLIYQGEVVRVTSGMWTSNVTLFLFDHQLVYCKKDLLKRNTFVYKGRICMDTSEVIDIPDGKDPQSGVTIRHGLKIYSCIRDKWLLFCCRNVEEKTKWLDALAEERKSVAMDRQNGLELPSAARQLARMSARSKRRPPNDHRSKAYKRESHYNGYKVGRKVGTWFTFGGGKKSTRMNLRTRNAPQHVT